MEISKDAFKAITGRTCEAKKETLKKLLISFDADKIDFEVFKEIFMLIYFPHIDRDNIISELLAWADSKELYKAYHHLQKFPYFI